MKMTTETPCGVCNYYVEFCTCRKPLARHKGCGECPACVRGDKCFNFASKPIESVKHDSDKPSLDLLPFSALIEVGKVLSYGAAKYSRDNWRNGNGLAWSRLLAAALRHLFAWGRGENVDQESGNLHLAHAAACVLFLLTYEVDGGGHDDRWGK